MRSYNSYMMSRNMKYTFQPEAKIYSKEEYNNLTANQKGQVLALKQRNGWIDGCTPPPGFQINKVTGEAEPSNQVVFTIRAATSAIIHGDFSLNSNEINSKPPPLTIIQPNERAVSDTTATHAGVIFGRPGKRHSSTNNSTISSVTVNGRNYSGPIFDERGNRLN